LAGQTKTIFFKPFKITSLGSRNGLYGRMRKIAKKMTDSEIIDLAHYYAGMDR